MNTCKYKYPSMHDVMRSVDELRAPDDDDEGFVCVCVCVCISWADTHASHCIINECKLIVWWCLFLWCKSKVFCSVFWLVFLCVSLSRHHPGVFASFLRRAPISGRVTRPQCDPALWAQRPGGHALLVDAGRPSRAGLEPPLPGGQ